MQDSSIGKAAAIAAFFGALTFVVIMTFSGREPLRVDALPTASVAP
jgi:hypothetical protein